MTMGGPHTIARPFECTDGVRHALCRTCDQRMFQGHDDRCPTCRAPRSGLSIASSGMRAHGVPVHQRRPDEEMTLQHFWIPDGGDQPVEGYVSVLARPGTDEVFASLEEMLSSVDGRRGLSRARIINSHGHGMLTNAASADLSRSLRGLVAALGTNAEEPAAQEAGAAVAAAAMEAMRADPMTAAALEGLRNPAEVPLGTFLQRVRGNTPPYGPTAQARRLTRLGFGLGRGR